MINLIIFLKLKANNAVIAIAQLITGPLDPVCEIKKMDKKIVKIDKYLCFLTDKNIITYIGKNKTTNPSAQSCKNIRKAIRGASFFRNEMVKIQWAEEKRNNPSNR